LNRNDKRTRFSLGVDVPNTVFVMPTRYADASATSFGIGCGNRTTNTNVD
jgi:hypothetical protein